MKRIIRRDKKGLSMISRNRFGSRQGSKSLRNKSLLKSNLKKLGICIIIVLLVVVFKSINFSFAQKTTEGIKNLITKEYNFKAAVASVTEFIPAVRSRVQRVFSDGSGNDVSMLMPVEGPVTSGYGIRVHPVFNVERKHEGIDIDAEVGEPVKAAMEGTVAEVRRDEYYGNVVVIEHRDDIKTVYAHLKDVMVKEGQQIGQGDIIGLVGSTGISTGPHLHFEVWKNGRTVDPEGEFEGGLKGM
jgi:murein DD-endopeptidase